MTKKQRALEIIERLKKNTRMPDALWITIRHGSCLSASAWRPSVPMPG